MSDSKPTPPPRTWRQKLLFAASAAVAIVAVTVWNVTRSGTPEEPARPENSVDNITLAGADATGQANGIIELPRSTWEAAGLTIEPASVAPLNESLHVTGTVSLNEDRVAHIFPLVEGRVDEVFVRFGQKVDEGDMLAVVQSKEVGERKLELVQARLSQRIATVNFERAEEVNRNAQALIAALKQQMPIERIEKEFENRPMGGYRERLVTAYTALVKAKADHDRLDDLTAKGVTSAKDLAAVKATYDAARATYAALLDEVSFEAKQHALSTDQTLQEVAARVAAAETFLEILGYSNQELANIDPAAEGETLSHYPVVAPFDGTILTKDAALLEAVGPERKLFEVADLSTVWIVADIYERHLPQVDALQGQTVFVRSDALPGKTVEAKVFFTGATVDPQTRTARLRAVAENSSVHLRPGMFVEVELPGAAAELALQIPEASLQDHAGTSFVFVHRGGDEFERRDVTAGRRSGGFVEVVSGLNPNEQVVASGGFALKSRMLADLLAGD